MDKLRRREDGAVAVEMGLVLPLLLVFLAFVAPLIQFGYEYMVVQRAASHGVRYATRADVNPQIVDGTPARRPSPDQVASFIADSSGGLVQASQVSVNPNPRQTLPGEMVEVTIDYQLSYGPLADVANAVKNTFFGGGAFLPSSTTVNVSARGREE